MKIRIEFFPIKLLFTILQNNCVFKKEQSLKWYQKLDTIEWRTEEGLNEKLLYKFTDIVKVQNFFNVIKYFHQSCLRLK